MDIAGNALWKYFGLTKPATPSEAAANPTEAKLDWLINEFSKSPFFSQSIEAYTAIRIRLGYTLRQLREMQGTSAVEAGEAIRASESKIAAIELGRIGIREIDVADLLTLYGVIDENERAELLSLASAANRRG
jgi:hypothetical protein